MLRVMHVNQAMQQRARPNYYNIGGNWILTIKRTHFRYIPSKESVLDIYHQKVTTLQLFMIFSVSSNLAAGFRFFCPLHILPCPDFPVHKNKGTNLPNAAASMSSVETKRSRTQKKKSRAQTRGQHISLSPPHSLTNAPQCRLPSLVNI